jgi:hypothetical protein
LRACILRRWTYFAEEVVHHGLSLASGSDAVSRQSVPNTVQPPVAARPKSLSIADFGCPYRRFTPLGFGTIDC